MKNNSLLIYIKYKFHIDFPSDEMLGLILQPNISRALLFSLGGATAKPNLRFIDYLTIDPKSANTRA